MFHTLHASQLERFERLGSLQSVRLVRAKDIGSILVICRLTEKYWGVFVVTRQEQKLYGNKGERIYDDMRFIVYFYKLSFCL